MHNPSQTVHRPIYTAYRASEPRLPHAHASRMHRPRSGLRPRTRTYRTPSCAPRAEDAERARFGSRSKRTSRVVPSEGRAQSTRRMRANRASAREPQGACAGARGGQRGARRVLGMATARLGPRVDACARGIKSALCRVMGAAISFSAYPESAQASAALVVELSGSRRARSSTRRVDRGRHHLLERDTMIQVGWRRAEGRALKRRKEHRGACGKTERVRHARILGKSARRSSAHGACPRAVWNATHLRGR